MDLRASAKKGIRQVSRLIRIFLINQAESVEAGSGHAVQQVRWRSGQRRGDAVWYWVRWDIEEWLGRKLSVEEFLHLCGGSLAQAVASLERLRVQ